MPEEIVIEMPLDDRSAASSRDSSKPKSVSFGSRIVNLTIDIPSSRRSQQNSIPPSKPRWKTSEFFFYYVLVGVAVSIAAWIPIQLSSPTHHNYPYYSSRLQPGWLFGRALDNSDGQYRSFRNNIPKLALLSVAYFTLKHIYNFTVSRTILPPPSNRIHLTPFIAVFSILMILGLHGTSAFKVILIISMNYWISKFSRGISYGYLMIWTFNVAVLFANETYAGYRYASLHSSLEFLDNFQGAYPRWHVNFNITMLRLVAFGMDYRWASDKPPSLGVQLENMSEKDRSSTSHPLDMYSYVNYIAYALYPPLYIAGPIMSFNDFICQFRHKNTLSTHLTFMYFVRFMFCFLTMEFILHFMYVVAIKDTKAWVGYSAAELSLVGFWNLMIVWLKLLLPWRFFRLWALVDGIDPPENMVRCMVNNYSTLGFWRSWHRTFNLWIVRYIYVPLGGTKNMMFSSVLIFTFVALWHDLSFRLLAWGWLVSLFFIPEISAGILLPQTKYGDRWWYRHICAVGAVFNIMTMLSANLVGFVIGTEGVSYMFSRLLNSWEGIRFLLLACSCAFMAVQVMFEYR